MRRFVASLLLLVVIAVPVAVKGVQAAPAVAKDTAPDFSLPDKEGISHHLADYRGKVVVLNFWATWCRECVLELPSLNALADRFAKDGLVVLGVSIDRNWVEIEETKNKAAYPVLLDAKGDVFVKQYTITRLPATIVIDRNGRIVERMIGRQDFMSGKFVGKIQSLLQGGHARL